MAGMRRGFKTWCENASRGYRRELGIATTAGLDPRRLAEHLGIVVWTPAQVPSLSPEDVHHLTVTARDEWSAATLRNGEESLIIINDAHDPMRQSNTLAHEIGHVVLRHGARSMPGERPRRENSAWGTGAAERIARRVSSGSAE